MALRTIKPSGGDYTSLSAWEAALPATLSEVETAECYAMQDTSGLTIDGCDTSAANYIRIYTPSTERHNGRWDTSKYRLDVSRNYEGTLAVYERYVRIEGLQFRNTANATWNQFGLNLNVENGGGVDESSTDLRVDACIAYGCTDHGFRAYGGRARFTNCISYGNGGRGFDVGYDHWSGSYSVNHQLFNCLAAANVGYGFYRHNPYSNVTTVARNCYAGGDTAADWYINGSSYHTSSNNYSEDGTASTTTAAYSTSSGCYFTNVTAGSQDFTLASASSALIDAGYDLSGTFTTDILGATRSGTWEVGPFNYGSSAQSYSYTAAGGLTLSGASTALRSRTAAPTGGLTLAGAATQSRAAARAAAGGLSLLGAASVAKGKTVIAAGGLSLSGAATQSRARAVAPAGGVILAGAADYHSSGQQSYSYSAVGGFALAGVATALRVRTAIAAGGVALSGAATALRARVATGAGGITLAGAAAQTFHESQRIVITSGGLVLSGASLVSLLSAAAAERHGGDDLPPRRRSPHPGWDEQRSTLRRRRDEEFADQIRDIYRRLTRAPETAERIEQLVADIAPPEPAAGESEEAREAAVEARGAAIDQRLRALGERAAEREIAIRMLYRELREIEERDDEAAIEWLLSQVL